MGGYVYFINVVVKMDKEIMKLMRTAIKKGKKELVQELLESYEDLINIDTPFGSWLHVAAAQGNVEIVKYLIECGMDVNKNGGFSGGTPIEQAASRGHLDVVKLLFFSGAHFDVSAAPINPLFAAIYGGYFDIVIFLVEKGIDISKQYDMGSLKNVDAYEYARQYGQTEIADYLKDKLEERKN